MELVGKTTIHPFFFYSGKICGYTAWVLFVLAIFDILPLCKHSIEILKIFALALILAGLIFAFVSLKNLGSSTRLGLPTGDTELKSNGLYRISRNPMYLGFDLITVGTIIYTGCPVIVTLGIYSIIIYHFIILGEEEFLAQKFGDKYIEYKKKVRRYI
jgi:protein-S-isoprenylcysteine O-methyltransferase Ste14